MSAAEQSPKRLSGAVRVSAFWFFGLGGLGLFFPYYSLYLRENAGLAVWQVGAVMATLPAVALVAQPAWGILADRSGTRTQVLSLLALGSAACYAALALGQGFASMLALTALLACFSSPLIPTAVSVTFAVTQQLGPHAFGLCRVWGTLGFGLFMFLLLPGLDAIERAQGLVASPGGPSEPALRVMFPLAGGVLAVAAALALRLPREGALAVRAERREWRSLLRHGPYLRLLAVVWLGYLLLQGPMAIFPLFVRAHGGSIDTVGELWLLMLALEVPLILLSGASLTRLGARGLLMAGLAAGGVRWTVCGFFPGSVWVVPVQLLHGAVVAGLILGGPLYVEALVPERLRSTGQNLLAMVGVSLGGLLSNLASGALFDAFGPDTPYRVGGVGALMLALALPLLLPRPERIDTGGGGVSRATPAAPPTG